LSIFVDSSVWFAAAVSRDKENARAKSILESTTDQVTTDHMLVETWLLLNRRYRREIADRFWDELRGGAIRLEMVTRADLEAAWAIGEVFSDQDFSLVDRTSFAVMERLGISQVASFDSDFAVYRYGRNREKAFEIVRTGNSEAFRLFHRAILDRKQMTFMYEGHHREVCPYILGHKGGREAALVFQFRGASGSGLPSGGNWKCLALSKARDIALRDGRWYGDAAHRATQRCVDDVYIDVNTDVPDQPGRR